MTHLTTHKQRGYAGLRASKTLNVASPHSVIVDFLRPDFCTDIIVSAAMVGRAAAIQHPKGENRSPAYIQVSSLPTSHVGVPRNTPAWDLKISNVGVFLMATNALSVFNFQEKTVRVELHNGEPLFCLTDVAEILDIKNANSSRFNLNKAGVHEMYTSHASGKKLATFINEPNLYRVIFPSWFLTNVASATFSSVFNFSIIGFFF